MAEDDGQKPRIPPVPLATPIYATSTFVFDNARAVVALNEGRESGYIYSRYGNPTVVAVEQELAALDGAEAALLFASGMAATSTVLLASLRSGDEVVCLSAVYGGTARLMTRLLGRLGVAVRMIAVESVDTLDQVLSARTRLFWFESPTNPTLRCVDIGRVAAACRARGVISVIDNTFASPVNQQPLACGVDLVMQSATKYLNGHSDLTAGVVTGSTRALQPIEEARRLLGGILDPHPAFLLGRGLKTLPVRVDRQNRSAATLAAFLEGDVRVRRVYYPGLQSHPDHAVARGQMRGFGGVVSLDIDGTLVSAERLYDRLRLFKRAASLGGVESVISLPVHTSHWGLGPEELAAAGVTPGMARLSIGLEDPADLIADLAQALAG